MVAISSLYPALGAGVDVLQRRALKASSKGESGQKKMTKIIIPISIMD
jgi:hypothetical protein